ncbi:MAG: glycosyltransferase family 87 protein [Myxococcota bacterium]|nr:glycosyltransferase family 87 protein [Myxococcota bacterium]
MRLGRFFKFQRRRSQEEISVSFAEPKIKSLMIALSVFIFALLFCSQLNRIIKLYSSSQHDVRATIACAHNYFAGRDIYKTHHRALKEDPTLTADIPKFTYPPLLCAVFFPMALMPYEQGKHVYFFLNCFFVIHTAFLLTLIAPIGWLKKPFFFLVLGVSIASEPFAWILRCANFDAMTLYVTAVSIWAYQREKLILSGILIATASWLKVTPGLIFIFLLMGGRQRFIVSAILSGLLLGIFQLMLVGYDQFAYFFMETLPERAGARLQAPSMQSLWSLNQLLFVPGQRGSIFDLREHFDVIHFLSRAVVAVMVLGVILRTSYQTHRFFYAFGVCSAATFLLTDSTYMYRLVWVIFPMSSLFLACILEKYKYSISCITLIVVLLNLQFLHGQIFGKLTGWKAILHGAPTIGALISISTLFVLSIQNGTWNNPLGYLKGMGQHTSSIFKRLSRRNQAVAAGRQRRSALN